MTPKQIQRLREIAHWLLTEAQDTTEVWDEFDVAAYDLKALADNVEAGK